MRTTIDNRECIVEFYALHWNVLCVAKANLDVNDWAAYIGPVNGKRHYEEFPSVLRDGEKLPKWIAEKMFPGLAADYKWRD